MSTLPHFLENLLIDGGQIIGLTRRASFTSYEDSWYSVLLNTESTPRI
jgi:hypothetical protein